MPTVLPSALLMVALAASLGGTVLLAAGAWRKRPPYLACGRGSAGVAAGALTAASLLLLYYLVSSDFRFAYVAAHSSLALPPAYRLAAFWAGQEGSFLLWALVLAWLAAYVARVTWRPAPALSARALAVMLAVNSFFIGLLVAAANPFEILNPAPADGAGLNPLLQNVGMLVHPAALYLGYVGFTVPFAFALAHLLTRTPGDEADWLGLTRPFSLFSWFFLSLGIILGMQWAYVELGWGGYWAWDPVENASLLPWLTATAFLHTGAAPGRRGRPGLNTVALIMATFFLTILGTFLTRTGLVASVHAFPATGLERYFLPFMALILVGAAYALVRGRHRLGRSGAQASPPSQRPLVGAAALLLLLMAGVVAVGTLFPLFSKLFGGGAVTLGPPFYLRAAVPIGAAVVALLGPCQGLGLGRAVPAGFAAQQVAAGVGAVALAIGLARALDPGPLAPGAVIGFSIAGFVFITGLWQPLRRLGDRWTAGRRPLGSPETRPGLRPRSLGALLVHLAVAAMVLGFSATPYREEAAYSLSAGEDVRFGAYRVSLVGIAADHRSDRVGVAAILEVAVAPRSQAHLLRPEQRYYPGYGSPFSEVAVLGGLREDLYVVLEGWTPDGRVWIRVIREPLVAWIWIGGYLLAAGGLCLAWPRALGLGRRAAMEAGHG